MRIAFILICTLFSFSSLAQQTKVKIVGPWEHRFGFNMGVNSSSVDLPGTTDIESNSRAGFTMGLSYEKRLLSKWLFAVEPSISLLDHEFRGENITENGGNYARSDWVMAELPFMLGYRQCRGRYKPTISAGPCWKRDLQSQSDLSSWSFDIQVGVERRLFYFALHPRLRYSHGLTDIPFATNNNPDQTIRIHSVSLILGFKG